MFIFGLRSHGNMSTFDHIRHIHIAILGVWDGRIGVR